MGLSDDLAHHYLIKEFLDPITNPHVIRFNLLEAWQHVSALLPRGAGALAAAAANSNQRFDDDKISGRRPV